MYPLPPTDTKPRTFSTLAGSAVRSCACRTARRWTSYRGGKTSRADIPAAERDDRLELAHTGVDVDFSSALGLRRRMKVFLECISTPTADTTGAAFVLHFDTKRYVFGNIHEGFQRSALQRGTKFTRISDLFLTGKTEWQSTGGTIGFLLTLADAVQSSQEALKDLTKKAQERTQKSGLPIKQIQSKEPEVPRLAIHGGPNITHTLATARRFIFRKGLPIDVFEHGPLDGNHALEPTWQDQFVRVWAMPIDPLRRSSYGATPPKRSFEEFLEQPESGPGDLAGAIQPPKEDDATKLSKLQGVIKDMFESNWRLDALFETPLRELKLPATIFERNLETKQLERYTERVAENPADRPDITVLVRKPWPGALVTRLPLTQPSSVSMSYLVRTHQQRGKFLPKKARELGVIPGDNYRKLAEGETITLGNGTVVSPEQVLEPPRPGSGFLIAEIPSVEYLDNFLSRPEFSESAIMDSLKAMVWLLGPGVGDNPRFQDFVRKHADTQHILASQDYNANRLVFESAAAATIRHAIIDPQRYDIPSFSNDAPALPEPLSHCRISESGLMVQFEPSFAIEMNANASLLNTKAVVSELPAKVREAAKAAQQEVQSETFTQQVSEQDIPGGDNEIITIGTGSAMPSKYRNVSATLLRVPGVGSYLLDCGENTLGQLARMYKPDDLRAILRDLKVIWISHLHADHHLGTTSVIKAWYKATADVSQPLSDAASRSPAGRLSQPGRLFIASDGGMIQWLKEYSEVEDIGRERLVLLDVMQAHDTTWVRWEDNEVGFASTDKEA